MYICGIYVVVKIMIKAHAPWYIEGSVIFCRCYKVNWNLLGKKVNFISRLILEGLQIKYESNIIKSLVKNIAQ
jgi:hypothetical protein